MQPIFCLHIVMVPQDLFIAYFCIVFKIAITALFAIGLLQVSGLTEQLFPSLQIKLGPGVFLTREKWQRVQEAKSHSQFCKSLAVAIWGTEGLKERSVTGAKCNAVKDSAPMRPLTPEKMTVIRGKYLIIRDNE